MNILQLHTWKDRKLHLSTLLFILPFILYSQENHSATAKLVLTVTDIRSNVGHIVVALYDNCEQWTDDPKYSFTREKNELVNCCLKVEIDSLPYGTYACAVFDDENKSGSMNYILGLPKEGWGMSLNPPFLKLKVPEFKRVSFQLTCPVTEIEIKMNYLNKHKKIQEK